MTVPVQVMKSGMSIAWTACPFVYSSPSAVKTESVPRVTMNGGSLSRVTRSPLAAPATRPTSSEISTASGPGTPCSALILAPTSMAKIAMAPQERSMPAVRMMRV